VRTRSTPTIDAARRLDPDHVGQKGIVAADHLFGDAARLHDLLLVVDVVQKGVDRAHTLFDPARQPRPFRARDDARDDVEGDKPLLGLGLAIDVEGDARQAEKLLCLALLGAQAFGVLAVEPVVKAAVGRAQARIRAPHFVEDFRFAHAHPRFLPPAANARRQNASSETCALVPTGAVIARKTSIRAWFAVFLGFLTGA
jgi:hypothetical protein